MTDDDTTNLDDSLQFTPPDGCHHVTITYNTGVAAATETVPLDPDTDRLTATDWGIHVGIAAGRAIEREQEADDG